MSNMRKFFQFIAFIVCLTMMLSILTACSSGESTQNENVVTFTDALGREVTVSKEPQRVATLIGSFADVWMLAGGSVCATAEDAWEDFGLELPNAVNIGGAHSPNLELIFSANPDFVIASASTSSNVEMLETLETAGITVNIISDPNILPQRDCNPDLLFDLQIGNTAVKHHDCHTNQPCKGKIYHRLHSAAYIHLNILRRGVLGFIVILFPVTERFKLDLRQSGIDDCTSRRGRVWNYADRTLNRNRD